MISLKAYPIPDLLVVGRVVKSAKTGQLEAVLVLPARGQVKVVNEVGARVWELADGSRTVQDIATVIYQEFQVERSQAEEDTLAFVADLVDRGVFMLSDHPGPEKQVNQA